MTNTAVFNNTITRDGKAAEYFTSDTFFELLRGRIESSIINDGETTAYLSPHTSQMKMKAKDMAYIGQTFKRLQERYPELNHARLNFSGDLIVDTKESPIFRALSAASTKKAYKVR